MNNEALNDGVPKKHTSPAGRRFGWKPDLKNPHHPKYSLLHPRVVELPPKIDLSGKIPYRFDQGDTSSCTGNSACYLYGFYKGVSKLEDAYSRMFYYYNERDYENDLNEDGGASIGDGIHLLAKRGVCLEKTWSFAPTEKQLFTKPSDEAYKEALTHKISSYSRLEKREDYRQCLAKGNPFTIGFSCYDNLDSDLVSKTGCLTLPGPANTITGGHAIICVGYDTEFHNSEYFKKTGLTPEQYPYEDVYLIINSWGDKWAQGGMFFMPAAYIDTTALSDDGWSITL